MEGNDKPVKLGMVQRSPWQVFWDSAGPHHCGQSAPAPCPTFSCSTPSSKSWGRELEWQPHQDAHEERNSSCKENLGAAFESRAEYMLDRWLTTNVLNWFLWEEGGATEISTRTLGQRHLVKTPALARLLCNCGHPPLVTAPRPWLLLGKSPRYVRGLVWSCFMSLIHPWMHGLGLSHHFFLQSSSSPSVPHLLHN